MKQHNSKIIYFVKFEKPVFGAIQLQCVINRFKDNKAKLLWNTPDGDEINTDDIRSELVSGKLVQVNEPIKFNSKKRVWLFSSGIAFYADAINPIDDKEKIPIHYPKGYIERATIEKKISDIGQISAVETTALLANHQGLEMGEELALLNKIEKNQQKGKAEDDL